MPFEVSLELQNAMPKNDVVESICRGLPECNHGLESRNSPENNPVWDEMPPALRKALSVSSSMYVFEFESDNGFLSLYMSDVDVVKTINGELRGENDWRSELKMIANLLGANVISCIDGSDYV